jgi:hypothetical protein
MCQGVFAHIEARYDAYRQLLFGWSLLFLNGAEKHSVSICTLNRVPALFEYGGVTVHADMAAAWLAKMSVLVNSFIATA